MRRLEVQTSSYGTATGAGTGAAKELSCTTPGCEQWWGPEAVGVLGGGRQRGNAGTTVIALSEVFLEALGKHCCAVLLGTGWLGLCRVRLH